MSEPQPSPARRPRSETRRSQVGAQIGARIEDLPPPPPGDLPYPQEMRQAPAILIAPPTPWEDTSTLLTVTEEHSFFKRQPPIFWIIAALLLVALLSVAGVVGMNALRDAEAQRAEERRLQQLADEKARYKLEYRDLIESYAAGQELPPALIAAVIYNESRFQPDAVSNVGARGLMQIMKDTGDWIAYRLGETDTYTQDSLFDPETNIRYGTWFLGYLYRSFGNDLVKIAAGYHAGQGALESWLKNPEYSSDGVTLEVIPYADTDQYVKRVVSAYEIYTRHYYPPDETQTSGV